MGREMIKAFKMRLEYGMAQEFDERHAAMWPAVEKMIHEYGGRDCTIFREDRTGYVFVTLKVDDEEKWREIRDDELCHKWLAHIAPTLKMTHEQRPETTPLRMVYHFD